MTTTIVYSLTALLVLPFVVSQNPPPCFPGSFRNGTECSLCPPGTYSISVNSRECISCVPGTFNPISGARGVDHCIYCPKGTFAELPGQASCQPCPSGTSSAIHGIRCKACPAGMRIRPFDSSCSRCDGRSIASEPNSVACTPCPINHVSDSTGTRCVPCPPGFRVFRLPNRTPLYACRICPRNAINDGSNAEFQVCPRGMGANGNRTKCLACRPGTANTFPTAGCTRCIGDNENIGVRGATVCTPPRTPCPGSHFRNKMGGCLTCNRAQRYDPMSQSCVLCGEREESDGGISTTCRPCGRQQVRTEEGCRCRPGFERIRGERCRSCPAGSFLYVPVYAEARCRLCPAGFFSARPGSSECTQCPPNMESFQNRTGCRSCPPGEVLLNLSLRARRTRARDVRRAFNLDGSPKFPGEECVNPMNNCPTGMLRAGGSRSLRVRCRSRSCQANTFAFEVPPGDDFPVTTFQCTPCPVNFVFQAVFGSCRACPSGSISPGGLSSSCTVCSENRVPQMRVLQGGREQSRCGCFGNFFLQNGRCVPCPSGRIAETLV